MKHILSLVMVAYTGLALADDWPNWRGPRHDGISIEKGWMPNFSEVAWRAQVGVGFSSFAVADGRVFTLGCTGKKQGNQETFYAMNASNF